MTTYRQLRDQAIPAWSAVEDPARPLVRVGIATCSLAKGADETLAALKAEAQRRSLAVDFGIVGCWGLCYAEPLVEVAHRGGRRILYGPARPQDGPALIERAVMTGQVPRELALAAVSEGPVEGVPPLMALEFMRVQERRLMADCGVIDPENIDHYIARGGYAAFLRILEDGMDPEQVCQQVVESGLWGRGGAAFSAGVKWNFLRQAQRQPKHIAVNADEGDPGAFVNRNIMESNPQLLVEGALICAAATGASKAFLYIRDEYPLCVERLRVAVAQARQRGLLGEKILGSGLTFDIEVVRGAGSYLCGEETGLISSVEGDRGMPKIRPPYPAQAGIFREPTNVNNVETLANVPLIFRHGVQWYRSVGTEASPGTKMFSLSGHIRRVGILEVPFGTPLRTVLVEAGGGLPEGRSLKAIQPGGPLGGILPAEALGIDLDLAPFRERGVLLGSGGLVVVADNACVVDLALYFATFAEDESCGRCTTCFIGTQQMVEILGRIQEGRGRRSDTDKLELLARALQWSNCFHGQGAPTAIKNVMDVFRDELLAHIEGRRCPARVCRPLLRYRVAAEGPQLAEAAEICPTEAIVPEGAGYRILDERCIRCGACREVAPEAIEVVDAFAEPPAR